MIKGHQVSHVSDVLQKNGFFQRKGDARKVANKIAGEVGCLEPLNETIIIKTAIEMGVATKPYCNKDSLYSGQTLLKDPIADIAVDWIVPLASDYFSSPDVIGPLLEKVMGIAVEEYMSIVQRDITPWDYSTYGRKTNQLYDLSKYQTIGDFLGEPSGNTVATYTSGSGLVAESWRYQVLDDVASIVMDKLASIAREGITNATKDISEFLEKLGSLDLIDEFVVENVYDSLVLKGISESDLVERIEGLPFRETLLKFRPDVENRLAIDIQAAMNQEAIRQKGQEALFKTRQKLLKRLEGRDFDDENFPELMTEVVRHATNPEGLVITELLFNDNEILGLLTKNARHIFLQDMQNWLEKVENAPDFSSPLVRLFKALDDAWAKNKRQWLVTITQNGLVSTFSVDNWAFFLAFALCGGYRDLPSVFGIVIRRFEGLTDPVLNVPIKTVSVIRIENGHVFPLDKNTMLQYFNNVTGTGKMLPTDTTTRIVEAKKLIPEFFAEQQ